MSEPLLEFDDVTIKYRTQDSAVTAVSDANFTIERGEYFGLVGESGCGKSTIAKAVVGGLDENGFVESGQIRYQGEEIQGMADKELNDVIRWKEISLMPQSSMNSLDPLQRIQDKAVELADIHTDMSDQEAADRLEELFGIVGIDQDRVTDYPHQFSGGMQQRAIIALALLLDPKLIIADEPTTALDVIMQDQVFKYLDDIKQADETSMLLITHDISLVFESCDRIAIMHAGQIAENGGIETVYDDPRHPYSILLQEAFPDVREPDRDLRIIEGVPPQVTGEVDFCTFVDRCPWAVEECRESAPELAPVGSENGSHEAACFRKDEVLEMYRAEGVSGETGAMSPETAGSTEGSQ